MRVWSGRTAYATPSAAAVVVVVCILKLNSTCFWPFLLCSFSACFALFGLFSAPAACSGCLHCSCCSSCRSCCSFWPSCLSCCFLFANPTLCLFSAATFVPLLLFLFIVRLVSLWLRLWLEAPQRQRAACSVLRARATCECDCESYEVEYLNSYAAAECIHIRFGCVNTCESFQTLMHTLTCSICICCEFA